MKFKLGDIVKLNQLTTELRIIIGIDIQSNKNLYRVCLLDKNSSFYKEYLLNETYLEENYILVTDIFQVNL